MWRHRYSDENRSDEFKIQLKQFGCRGPMITWENSHVHVLIREQTAMVKFITGLTVPCLRKREAVSPFLCIQKVLDKGRAFKINNKY